MVTVLLPVYNAEAYIADAIQSIICQTFGDFELLIINDGSSDRSLEIINSFDDKRIRIINNETNIKLIATLNKGIDLAGGKYIVRMDADDINLPQRLQKQVDFMEANPNVGVSGSWFETFGTHEQVVKYPEKDEDIRIMMLYQTPFCHPSIIFRKEVFEKYNIRFLPEFIHAEDYEVWVRLSEYTQFANIPEVLLKYRMHEKSVSASHQDVQLRNTIKIVNVVFEKAGVQMNDRELMYFREIAYSNFTAEKALVLEAEKILTKLIRANQKTQFLPEHALRKFVSEKWFHLCYNTTSLGSWVYNYFYQSSLSGLMGISFINRLKFAAKVRLGLLYL